LLQQQIIMYMQRIDIATIYPQRVRLVKSAKIFAPGLTPAAQHRAEPLRRQYTYPPPRRYDKALGSNCRCTFREAPLPIRKVKSLFASRAAPVAVEAAPVEPVPEAPMPDAPASDIAARDMAAPAIVTPPAPPPTSSAGPHELETGGILTIDLAAIAKNWKALATRVVPTDCAAVVKADAYGCGLDQVVRHLVKAGCKTFFVAHMAEARRVRTVTLDAEIYVLNGIAPGNAAAFAQIDARPVIGTMAEYVEWDAFRNANGWRGGAALHFDTGMNRLGLTVEEAPTFAFRVKSPDHGIALVMSHLACADTPHHPLNDKQIAAFRELRFLFRGIPTSLANSSGIFLGPAAHCDMVRPGAALYGVNPTPATQSLMDPVVTLKARIVQVRDVAKGMTVGYGASWTADNAGRIAVVSAGYADGYLRAAGKAGAGTKAGFSLGARFGAKRGAKAAARTATCALIAGRPCPIVGRISMDLMAFDVTGLPAELVRRGDYATLIGDGITVDELAAWSGTIGYEVLTGLGQRYRRVWTR
jgi:alanine racemase